MTKENESGEILDSFTFEKHMSLGRSRAAITASCSEPRTKKLIPESILLAVDVENSLVPQLLALQTVLRNILRSFGGFVGFF